MVSSILPLAYGLVGNIKNISQLLLNKVIAFFKLCQSKINHVHYRLSFFLIISGNSAVCLYTVWRKDSHIQFVFPPRKKTAAKMHYQIHFTVIY